MHDLPIASYLADRVMKRQFADADAPSLTSTPRTAPARHLGQPLIATHSDQVTSAEKRARVAPLRRVRVAIAAALNRAAAAVAPSPDCSPLR